MGSGGKDKEKEHKNNKVDGGGGEGRWGTWMMGTPAAPQGHPANQQAATWVAVEYVPTQPNATNTNPAHMNYTAPAQPNTTTASPQPPPPPYTAPANIGAGNPYVQVTPVPGSSGKTPMEMILKVLGRCGKKLEVTTRKAGTTAENVWHHLKTGPSLTDAAMARLSQGTKVLAEGGHDKIFQQTFGTLQGEKLHKAYACYFSTSSGPVIGTLYISTKRIAFCSDNPLCRSTAPGQQEWVYYKVIMPLNQLAAVTPSANRLNANEKYIQIVTTDGSEFWFMGFVSYDKALKNLTEALQHHSSTHKVSKS